LKVKSFLGLFLQKSRIRGEFFVALGRELLAERLGDTLLDLGAIGAG
jgi:hypothetical protein